ncbi:MAG: hypothetical protein WD579_02635 [Candidatus Paceibacterota bacterium]
MVSGVVAATFVAILLPSEGYAALLSEPVGWEGGFVMGVLFYVALAPLLLSLFNSGSSDNNASATAGIGVIWFFLPVLANLVAITVGWLGFHGAAEFIQTYRGYTLFLPIVFWIMWWITSKVTSGSMVQSERKMDAVFADNVNSPTN